VEGGDLAYVEERIIADGELLPRLSARLTRYIG
ncbi:FABP family protein, partial [Rhodococcus oxybenzonivorans]|nr:FABP family protein [Rhodococcus oxybenzonivorans]